MAKKKEVGNLKATMSMTDAEFKKSIKTISNQMKIVTEDFKQASIGLDKLGDKTKINGLKIENLTKNISNQKELVAQLKLRHKELSDAYGAGSAKAVEYEAKLKKAETGLKSMENELKDAQEESRKLNNRFGSLGDKALVAGTKMKTAGSKLRAAGSSMTMGLTLPILGAVAALGALIKKSVDAADQIKKTAEVYGMSSERIQELTYIGAKLDVELTDITKSQVKLTKSMDAARNGTKASAKAFKDLGVNAFDPTTKKLRDSNVVFEEAIEALHNMKNPTERNSIALKLFGKSALALNPLIKASSGEVKKLTKEARDSGAVMSNESVEAMDEFGDSIEALKLTIQGLIGKAIAKLMPKIKELIPIIQDKIVPAIGKFFEGIMDLIMGFDKLDPTLQKVIVGAGIFLTAIGPVVGVIGAIVTAIGGLTTALTFFAAHPAVLAITAITTLYGVIGICIANTDRLTESTKNYANEVANAKKGYQGQISDIKANATVVKRLTDKLYDLAEKENKSNKQKEKMKLLVGQINSMMPELNLKIDAHTGKLNKSRVATEKLIDKQIALLKLNAQKGYLSQLYKDIAEGEMKLMDAQKELGDKIKMMMQYKGSKALEGQMRYSLALEDVKTAQVNVNKLSDTLKTAKTNATVMEKTYTEAATNTKKASSGAKNSITKDYKDIQKSIDTATNKTQAFKKKFLELNNIKDPVLTPKVKWDKIPLPKFSFNIPKATGNTVKDAATLASVNLRWLKEGAIINRATVVGVGEDGPEAVVPLDKLKGIFKSAVSEMMRTPKMAIAGATNNSTTNIYKMEFKGSYSFQNRSDMVKFWDETAKEVNRRLKR